MEQWNNPSGIPKFLLKVLLHAEQCTNQSVKLYSYSEGFPKQLFLVVTVVTLGVLFYFQHRSFYLVHTGWSSGYALIKEHNYYHLLFFVWHIHYAGVQKMRGKINRIKVSLDKRLCAVRWTHWTETFQKRCRICPIGGACYPVSTMSAASVYMSAYPAIYPNIWSHFQCRIHVDSTCRICNKHISLMCTFILH